MRSGSASVSSTARTQPQQVVCVCVCSPKRNFITDTIYIQHIYVEKNNNTHFATRIIRECGAQAKATTRFVYIHIGCCGSKTHSNHSFCITVAGIWHIFMLWFKRSRRSDRGKPATLCIAQAGFQWWNIIYTRGNFPIAIHQLMV